METVTRLLEEYKFQIRENHYYAIGGQNCFPFHAFEGTLPHMPKIALEVYDTPDEEWPEAVAEVYRDVWKNPVDWAKTIETKYKPDMICLQLASTDPMGDDASPEKAADVAKSVAEAISLPLIVYGCGNAEKDGKVLKKVAEALSFKKSFIGPVVEGNYNTVGAALLAYDHYVIAQTPTDVNLCKQLNILLSNLGVSLDKIIIDPTPSALGYGLEYTYSIMEKIRCAAFQTNDDKLNLPIIGNIAREVWKIKEVKIDDESMGDTRTRGIFFEAMTAISYILAGADIVVLRHPQTMVLIRKWLADMSGTKAMISDQQAEDSIQPLAVSSQQLIVSRQELAVSKQETANLDGRIIQAAFSVFRELGEGLTGDAYANAMVLELKQQGLEPEREIPIVITYKGVEIGSVENNIRVGDTLVVIGCKDKNALHRYLLSQGLSCGIG
ncbi:MAG: acetyl-CoA decarbonylase/synthase complex subunit delta, partial [Candidatus Desantisbacteria bacterium]